MYLKPNGGYVLLLLLGIMLLGIGTWNLLAGSPVIGGLGLFAGILWLVGLGSGIALSTVCRVPVLVIDESGLRFPLMGPRLSWNSLSSVEPYTLTTGPKRVPMLLVMPVDSEAVVRSSFLWLRHEARHDLRRFGTPLVIRGASLSCSLDDILAAIEHYRGKSD